MPTVVKANEKARLRFWFPEAKLTEHQPQEPCHPGCFPEGTLVLTESGWRAIEFIQVGEQLVAFDQQGQRWSVPVSSIFKTRNRLLEIDTGKFTFWTTPQQPLATSLSHHVAAGDLKPDDCIVRWQEGQFVTERIERVSDTGRIAQVYNLVLTNSEMFLAGGVLVRSKPPAESKESSANVARATIDGR